MKKTVILYDDSRIADRRIRNITGNKSFGNTIYKRISLRERTASLVRKQSVCALFVSDAAALSETDPQNAVVKLYSNMVIRNEEAFGMLAKKALYAKECYRVDAGGEVAAVIYPDFESFQRAFGADESTFAKIESDAFLNLSSVDAFRRFITGGFDARFFNELSGDDYTVTKHSTNVEKLRREYTFYGLLPEEMKMWFAMPFSYQENGTEASYTMERYHMTDLAIRYVHGAISPEEFEEILQKIFHFISSRTQKEVSGEEYDRIAQDLYVGKVERRIADLKKQEGFEQLNTLLAAGSKYRGIDDVFAAYKEIYGRITKKKKFRPLLVVGHGDLCFSNILYSHETAFLKLIDPKGAMSEEELYTNPYYDLAKLSHSICGSYDYFNSDLFEITIDDEMRWKLTVDCDNRVYCELFRKYLDQYDLDGKLIRLYEASLFLSMLPLHMDRQKKVLGFVFNAIEILEGLENE